MLSISCLSQSAKPKEGASSIDDPVQVVEVVAKKAEDVKGDDGGVALDETGWGFPEAVDDGGDEAGAAPPDTSGDCWHADGCGDDEMRFEGKCVPKDRVEKILDRRERKALRKVQNATKPAQKARAVHDLLEQQVAQMDKTEDDLDEIIEYLREEKAKKKGSKKGDF